jgi:hypothetical protein
MRTEFRQELRQPMRPTNAPSRTLIRPAHLKLGIAAGLAIACASTLFAQRADQPGGPPTTRPAWPGGMGGGSGGRMGGVDVDRPFGGAGRRGPGEGWQSVPPPTADEWEEVVTFMQENSPVRLQMYQKLESEKGADSNITIGVRKRAFVRYRELKALGDRKSDLYDFAFKQFKIEDDVLATLAQIRRDGEKPALVEQRCKQIHEFVRNALDERKVRLDKLREYIAREEANLANDRADVAALEEKQRERFDREMKRLIDFAVDSDSTAATKPAN